MKIACQQHMVKCPSVRERQKFGMASNPGAQIAASLSRRISYTARALPCRVRLCQNCGQSSGSAFLAAARTAPSCSALRPLKFTKLAC